MALAILHAHPPKTSSGPWNERNLKESNHRQLRFLIGTPARRQGLKTRTERSGTGQLVAPGRSVGGSGSISSGLHMAPIRAPNVEYIRRPVGTAHGTRPKHLQKNH